MAEQREQYLLNQTAQFSLDTGAENRSDLSLAPNPEVNTSVIISTVLNNGNPVTNALVKVLTVSGDPVDHQFTNAVGQTVSKRLSAGAYMVMASAPGYISSTPTTVNLPNTTGVFVDITLAEDPRAALNTLYGLVLDDITNDRLGSATVLLSDSSGVAVSSTSSDDQGEYLFCEIANGSYQLTAIKNEYTLSSPITITVTGAQLSQTDILLTPEITTNGTVQGFIRDERGNLLGNAFVALYSISGGTETLIQETLSNHNGFYLFGNVSAGVYLVKSKVDVLI